MPSWRAYVELSDQSRSSAVIAPSPSRSRASNSSAGPPNSVRGDPPVLVLVAGLEPVPGVAGLGRAEPADAVHRLAGEDGVPHPQEFAPVPGRRVGQGAGAAKRNDRKSNDAQRSSATRRV